MPVLPLSQFFVTLLLLLQVTTTSSLPSIYRSLNNAVRVSIPIVPSGPSPAMTVSVIAHGGDATGVLDSSAALAAALSAAISLASSNSLPSQIGSGGVAVDLGGGTFRCSQPLLVRGGMLGVVMRGGTLVADVSIFPKDGYLIDVESVSDFSLQDVTLDSQHVGGCLRLDTVVQFTVRDVFFLHYATEGIFGSDQGGASHELMVTQSFFAEFMWGEVGFDNIMAQSGTAIYLSAQFYDSNFYDSIIRCTRVGVVNLAGANLWHGVHIYATCNKDPSGGNVSVGFINLAYGQTRISSCYFDDSPFIQIGTHELTLKDSLFYGFSGLIFAPVGTATPAAGIFVSGNLFTSTPYSGSSPTVHYDNVNGTFATSALASIVVADNQFSNRSSERATRVTATIIVASEGNATAATARLDLRSRLLFSSPNAYPFHWRNAASHALARIADMMMMMTSRIKTETPPRPADVFGGAFATFQISAALLTVNGVPAQPSIMSSGYSLSPTLFATETPGIIDVAVGASFVNYTALVSLSLDAALPTGAV